MKKLIDSFVDLIIENKKLKFSSVENYVDDILCKKKILKLEGDFISIDDFKLIASHFIGKYKKKLHFKLKSDFQKNVDFINLVKQDFTDNNYIPDYHLLEKEIWKLIIIESNSKYRCSFKDYLKENKTSEVFGFIKAYSDILVDLNLTENEIIENAISQTEITKSDADYNQPLNNVLGGVKNKCKSDFDIGIKLLNLSLVLDEDKDYIISAVVSGLYENKRHEFYEGSLKKLIQEEKKLDAVLFGLSTCSGILPADCTLFVKLIEDIQQNKSFSIAKISLVFAILRSENDNYHNFCFKELELAIENVDSAFYILNNLSLIKNYGSEKTNILLKLVNQNYFTIAKYISGIGQFFWYINEFYCFKKVVLTLIENKPFEKFIKPFQSFVQTVDPIELDSFLIELLIDNASNIRFTGIEIFDCLSFNRPYCFSLNILDLPSISQYKLWVALTQDFHEPKKRLTALLPLIDSKSKLVKESFLSKLEEISEDYGGHITEILETNLNKKNPNHSIAITRLKKYLEDFCNKNTNLKRPILELNPYHTHYKYFQQFGELFSKKMQKTVEKDAKKNSLLSFFGSNTIHLSKGGGWRIGPKREISQLGKIETSMAMPRGYFIYPNEYEIGIGSILHAEWTTEEYSDINIILENE